MSTHTDLMKSVAAMNAVLFEMDAQARRDLEKSVVDLNTALAEMDEWARRDLEIRRGLEQIEKRTEDKNELSSRFEV